MAAQTGNTYISGTIIDSIKIHSFTNEQCKELEAIQRRACQIIVGGVK